MSPDLINEILEIINNNEHIVLDKTELETVQASYEYNEMMKMPAIDITYNDIKWIYYEYQGEDVINKIVNNCKKIYVIIIQTKVLITKEAMRCISGSTDVSNIPVIPTTTK